MPNMALRQYDEEMFEDDSDEFIRRDIEGSGLWSYLPTATGVIVTP